MLVLSRSPGQTIEIGPDITLTIIKYERGQVRVGIDAPQSIPIARGEMSAKGKTKESVPGRNG